LIRERLLPLRILGFSGDMIFPAAGSLARFRPVLVQRVGDATPTWMLEGGGRRCAYMNAAGGDQAADGAGR